MTRNHHLLSTLAALLLCGIAFCGCGEKKQKESQLTGFEQSMTNADSTEVVNLVEQFFSAAEAGDFDGAAAMLYENKVDSVNEEPQPLDNKSLQRVRTLLSSLPIIRHSIDYIKFYETYANEVKCTAVLQEAHDNVPEIKTVYYFKPINYLGKWKLCLMDSHHGDHTVIDGDKRDSVTSHYEAEMREKYQREHQQQQ